MPRSAIRFSVAAIGLALTLAPANSQTPSSTQRSKPYECTNDPKGVRTCRKPAVPNLRPQGTCTFTCTLEEGVPVCRGSGRSCNGLIPPGW